VSITSYIDDPYANVLYGGSLCPADIQSRPTATVGSNGLTSILRRRQHGGTTRQSSSRRVTFEGVSLLLSAALEGEMDIVKETINKVCMYIIIFSDGDSCLSDVYWTSDRLGE